MKRPRSTPLTALPRSTEPSAQDPGTDHYGRREQTPARERERLLAEMEALRLQRLQALELLAAREQELAQIPALRGELRASEARRELERAELTRQADELRAQLAHVQAVLAGVTGSLSWSITAPLRALKQLLRPR